MTTVILILEVSTHTGKRKLQPIVAILVRPSPLYTKSVYAFRASFEFALSNQTKCLQLYELCHQTMTGAD